MENIFREFVFTVFYRLRVVIIVFLAVFIISIIVTVTLPSAYRSTAKFSMIITESFDPLRRESSFEYGNRMRRILQEQRELAMSNQTLAKVVQELNHGSIDQSVLNKQIGNIRRNMNVAPPGGETFEGSPVFVIEFTDRNPEWAFTVATSIAQNYQRTFREISRSKTSYSYSFFQEQTEGLYEVMLDKKNRVREFETKEALALLEILNLGEEKANVEVGPNLLLTQFLQKYYELQTELAGLQMTIGSLEKELSKDGIPAVLPEMEVTGRSITVLKNKIAQLQIQLNEMEPQFMEEFLPVQRVRQELNLSVDSLKKEMENTLKAKKITAQAIQARIGQLENIIQSLKERIKNITQGRTTYQDLLREYNIAKEAYTNATSQKEQARMSHALSQDIQHLTLIDKPEVPSRPFKPNRMLLAIGGLFSGIFLGIAAALTIDHFDHRMKTLYEIKKYLNVPVWGAIPSL